MSKAGKLLILFLISAIAAALLMAFSMNPPHQSNYKVTANFCEPGNFRLQDLAKVKGVLTLAIDENFYRWIKNNSRWIEIEFEEEQPITVGNGNIMAKKVLMFKSSKITVLAIYTGRGWYCYGLDGELEDFCLRK